MNPALAATLQNIADLRADVTAFNATSNSPPDATQRVSLLNHLSAAAQGNKPTAATLKKFADDLIAAVSGIKMTAMQQQKIARDVHAVLNGAHLTAVQQQMMFDEVQKILTDAGVAPDGISSVATDLKAAVAGTQ